MQLELVQKHPFVVGTKEALRAVKGKRAESVLVGSDCEERVIAPLLTACEKANVPVNREYTRAQLGEACKLKVKAAAIAILV